MVGNSAIVRYPERGSGAYLLFSPFTNFLTTSSTHCDQHYQLATMGKEAINPGSSTTMKTETVDVTDEETAELHLYKNMHLLPSNEANSSNVSKFNLFNQNLHQNKSESSNPPVVQTPDQHINPKREQSSNTSYVKTPAYILKTDYSVWFCGHCRQGPMKVGYNYHCIFCTRQKDSISYYGSVYSAIRGQ